jgi:hypothetical protein
MAGVGDEAAFDNIADPDLPFITVGQARRIRSLVRTAFAENGREVTVFSDHVRDDRGRVFGLWNVASACGADPAGETAWPGVVGAHVLGLLAAVGRDIFAGLSGAEVRARTYARLYPADQVNPDMFGHATEALPGLLELLAARIGQRPAPEHRHRHSRIRQPRPRTCPCRTGRRQRCQSRAAHQRGSLAGRGSLPRAAGRPCRRTRVAGWHSHRRPRPC